MRRPERGAGTDSSRVNRRVGATGSTPTPMAVGAAQEPVGSGASVPVSANGRGPNSVARGATGRDGEAAVACAAFAAGSGTGASMATRIRAGSAAHASRFRMA